MVKGNIVLKRHTHMGVYGEYAESALSSNPKFFTMSLVMNKRAGCAFNITFAMSTENFSYTYLIFLLFLLTRCSPNNRF